MKGLTPLDSLKALHPPDGDWEQLERYIDAVVDMTVTEKLAVAGIIAYVYEPSAIGFEIDWAEVSTRQPGGKSSWRRVCLCGKSVLPWNWKNHLLTQRGHHGNPVR